MYEVTARDPKDQRNYSVKWDPNAWTHTLADFIGTLTFVGYDIISIVWIGDRK